MAYELRAFRPNLRGRLVRVNTLTTKSADAHTIAVEFWRLAHVPGASYVLEVRDLGAKRGKLIPLVTYEELVKRAGSLTVRCAGHEPECKQFANESA